MNCRPLADVEQRFHFALSDRCKPQFHGGTPLAMAPRGGVAEWTHVRVGGAQNARVFGIAFLGIGAELNVTRELKLGGNLRMQATAQPTHDSETHAAGTALSRQALTTEQHHDAELRLGVAAQGQLLLRHAL